MSTTNEIKKYFYKNGTTAYFDYATKYHLQYHSIIHRNGNNETITFFVPLGDIGDARFFTEMPAKHMIRYLQQ